MNGRRYFDTWARELRIDRLDPDEIAELEPLPVERGPAESKLGGRITRDLKLLRGGEAAAQRRAADQLLKEPSRHFPAESS